jgi:hypothetical protein
MPLLFALFGCSGAETPPANVPAGASPAGATSPAVGTAPESPAGTSPAGSQAGPPGATCGGIAGLGCAAGGYCSYPPDAQCGAADQTGTCEAIPSACTKEFSPVCGCDDKTYPNACGAASAGVSVLKKGECS